MKTISQASIFTYWILLLVMMLIGCSEKQTSKPSTSKPPFHVETKSLRPKEKLIPKPIIVTVKTREAYQWYCAQCHGIEGKGDGINAKFLTVPPRNHTKPQYLETRTDKQLFEAIKFGGLSVGRAPCMPAWGHTMDEEIMHQLVRYIRELCQCESL
tara:strand:- start:162 stop:629 length:468 start_codon:yes stop_codon:yes gene_type:complete